MAMGDLLKLPGQAYDYIDREYGIIGLIVAALLIVVAGCFAMFWFDRRK